ncbi:hypothetical protein NQ176_g8419 [Zarea fungicola]|uniref:Uncharacterized protein n=1 Tax=Zarea fungicola TaxID=93591 RepID=A0ACC1MUA6_9HYPO|nr:hypothetical protein NQ176_g8419 [Lecanicillium fungicola]
MKWTTAIFALATATGAFAAPTAEIVEDRAATVTCRPTLNGQIKPFRVDLGTAQSEARRVGLAPGKSGDPHRYFNGDGIHWGVQNCDKPGAILLEYPIYQIGKNAQWQKDTLTSAQKGGPTPLRTVFANANGGVVFCGVMTHSQVNAQNQGLSHFSHCT